jgi:hypothetical protein
LHGKKFRPWLCHEDRNCSHFLNHTYFVKRKAFPKRFCDNDNNKAGNMFRGIDTALTIFMMRHKLQRQTQIIRTHTVGISVRRPSCWYSKTHEVQSGLFYITLFTMFTVKMLQYKIVLLCTKISSVEMYKKWSVKYCQKK